MYLFFVFEMSIKSGNIKKYKIEKKCFKFGIALSMFGTI